MKITPTTQKIGIGLTIKKTSIRTRNGFISQNVIGAYTKYEDKEKVEVWAKENGGSWHPAERFWWIPLKADQIVNQLKMTVRALGYAIAYAGDEILISTNLKAVEFLQNNLPSQIEVEKDFMRVFESNINYLSIGDYAGRSINPENGQIESYQLQSIIILNDGTPQRVVLTKEKPEEFLGVKPRKIGEYWAMPWCKPLSFDVIWWKDEIPEEVSYLN